MKKIMQIILGSIGCLFLIFTGKAQTKPTTDYQYCYCPTPSSALVVKTNAPLRFTVSNFSQGDISKIEFQLTPTDTGNFRQSKARLTAKARFPWGRIISNDPIIEDKQITFKSISRLFVGNEKSVDVFVHVSGNHKSTAFAGPITIYRGLKGSTEFENQCRKNCPDKQPVLVAGQGWAFNPPSTMVISKTGEKNEVVGNELMNLWMLPTDGMMAMMDKLNYAIYLKDIIPAGTTCVLPRFPEIGAQQQKDLLQQFESDNEIDPVQNAVFLERSKFLVKILANIELPANSDAIKNDVTAIHSLLTGMVERNQAGLKKMQTDILNSEIENFSNFLVDDFAKNNKAAGGVAYIRDFKNYLFEVVQAGSQGRAKPATRGSETGSQNSSHFTGLFPHIIPAAAKDLKVYIYAFENENSAPLNRYFIYCITQFQYDQLLKKKSVTIADLNKITTRCQDPASASAKLLNPSFPYYFIAVSTVTKEIRMCNKVDIKTLSKISESKFIDKPYAVSLYPIDKCF